MSAKKNNSPLKMKTLSERANEAYDQGYSEYFKVIDKKLTTKDEKFNYDPAEVTIENSFRFEGTAHPKDTSILYLIETRSGKRGTLIDAYGVSGDAAISSFVREVADSQEK